jgi:hypothetical protein
MQVEATMMPAEKRRKVWNANQIFWAAGFGSVLAGLYLVSENYKALGYPQLAKKTLLTGFISTIILMTLLFFTSEESISHFAPFLVATQCVVAGGYVIWEHYKLFYNKNFSKQLFVYLPLLALMILTLPFYLPKTWTANIPHFFLAMIPALCIQSLAQFLQSGNVKSLIEKGSKKGSTGRLLGIISLTLLIQLCLIVTFVLLSFLIYPDA